MKRKKHYTQNEAMEEIFFNNKAAHSDKMLVQKHRYLKGTLSQKSVDSLLKKYNFVVYKPTIYKKICLESTK